MHPRPRFQVYPPSVHYPACQLMHGACLTVNNNNINNSNNNNTILPENRVLAIYSFCRIWKRQEGSSGDRTEPQTCGCRNRADHILIQRFGRQLVSSQQSVWAPYLVVGMCTITIYCSDLYNVVSNLRLYSHSSRVLPCQIKALVLRNMIIDVFQLHVEPRICYYIGWLSCCVLQWETK